jgi:NifU-like protein
MKRVSLSFNQKPFLISSSSDLGNFKVYLDINNKSRLEGMYFECPKDDYWFNHFESLAHELERVQLRDLPKVLELWKTTNKNTFKDFYVVPPVELLSNALDKYYGRELGHSNVSGYDSDELLCRCFGVYKSQIKELVEENENVDLKLASNELKVSIGCTTCSDSVVKAIDFFNSKKRPTLKIDIEREFDEQGQRVRPLGLAPSEFVLKIDTLAKSWTKEQELKDTELEILSIKGHALKFKVKPNKNAQYILETFNEYANEKLGLVLRFDLLL